MQTKNLVKSLLIVIPALTMMACTSKSSVDEQASTNGGTDSSTYGSDSGTSSSQVETGTVSAVKTPDEVRRETIEALQSDQTVYFDFDRSSVSTKYYSILNKHAEFLVKNPGQKVVIEGHCDSRGTPEYNIALGERRAKSVQTYLQNAGVSSSQISVVSYGEEKPEVRGSTESAFAKNRRGILTYR
jgi:peptidoglycan-associated lipoprotein